MIFSGILFVFHDNIPDYSSCDGIFVWELVGSHAIAWGSSRYGMGPHQLPYKYLSSSATHYESTNNIFLIYCNYRFMTFSPLKLNIKFWTFFRYYIYMIHMFKLYTMHIFQTKTYNGIYINWHLKTVCYWSCTKGITMLSEKGKLKCHSWRRVILSTINRALGSLVSLSRRIRTQFACYTEDNVVATL